MGPSEEPAQGAAEARHQQSAVISGNVRGLHGAIREPAQGAAEARHVEGNTSGTSPMQSAAVQSGSLMQSACNQHATSCGAVRKP